MTIQSKNVYIPDPKTQEESIILLNKAEVTVYMAESDEDAELDEADALDSEEDDEFSDSVKQ